MITEDHYVPEVIYRAGSHTFTRDDIGTRSVALPLRILVNPNDPADVAQVHALQDGVTVRQAEPGSFAVPDWDPLSRAGSRSTHRTTTATPSTG